MIDIGILNELNAPTREERLDNLRRIAEKSVFPPLEPLYINNHIHTFYSFSPYSPAAAVYAARAEGLCTAGIIDHDSIAGAGEFIEAGRILDMPVTVGMECRVSMAGTSLEGRRTNNPDQAGVSYMTIQSVPHDSIEYLNARFAPYREARHRRSRAMIRRMNQLLRDIELDYDRRCPAAVKDLGGRRSHRAPPHVRARPENSAKGRARKRRDRLPRGRDGVALSPKQRAQLSDIGYPFYEYDLLGILKSSFLPGIYIDADEECPSLDEIAGLCRDIDALLCYAYLGDVTDSVTGDKKAQKFEDDFLDEVMECMAEHGVRGVTYMPTRNTPAQLARIRELAERHGFIQVSGEDINSPRQSFVIRAMDNPAFSNLIESTWKLIDHETKGAKL